jgi:hypothetical protein
MRSSPAGTHLYIRIYYYVSSALCAESKRESIICTPLLTGSIVFNFLIDDSVTVCVKLPSMHSSLSAPVINENAHPGEYIVTVLVIILSSARRQLSQRSAIQKLIYARNAICMSTLSCIYLRSLLINLFSKQIVTVTS